MSFYNIDKHFGKDNVKWIKGGKRKRKKNKVKN